MAFHEYPYTDFHEMNLDWIIKQMKELVDSWDSFGGNVEATAHESLNPEVSVSGDLKTQLDFDFGLVRGNEGPRGPEGPEGPQGKGLEILGVYATLSDLQTAHPTGNAGDVYLVGSGGSYVIYVWSEDNSDWENGGPITSPVPATASPLMDDVASVGSSLKYAREDHVHPSDTAKQDLLVSGTNIKELNGYSLLGNGNLTVQETLVSGTNIKTINSEDVLGSGDISVQETLVSGTNIKTINNNSLLGSGNINILPAGVTLDLLWTNANPASAFSAQTISVDLTDYNILVLTCDVSNVFHKHIDFLLIKDLHEYSLAGSLDVNFRRIISNITDSGIAFDDAGRYATYGGTATTDNILMIPYKLYGLK